MNRRQSTNYKLSAIIHANANTDAQSELYLKNREKKARQKLLRACLYGGGARVKLPRTKRSKKYTWSPYVVAGGEPEELPPKKLEHSIPPGAHNDMYRVVTNPTRRSSEDPDRVFLNSHTMSEGIKTLPQPPWYVGYNNNTVPPDSNAMMTASRYGFRGSKNIQQHNTPAYRVPTETLTDQTPKFLQQQVKTHDYIDEYVPPILATKYNTINGMETPKAWPENTEYVTGFRKKKLPTIWKYKRQTTVYLPEEERPKSPKPLSMIHSKSLEQSQLLSDYAKMESKKSFLSLPMTCQLKFETQWNDVVKEEASRPLKYSLHRMASTFDPSTSVLAGGGTGKTLGGTGGGGGKSSREDHGLMDPSDTMRYTSTASMIIHTKSTDELKFRLRMEKTKAKVHTPFTLKWQHVIGHFENINHNLKKHQTMSDAIDKIAQTLQQTAIQHGSQTAVKRIEFIQTALLIPSLEGISEKQFSQLYSIFDPMKKNNVRFIELILCFLVLDHPEALPIPKLQILWRYVQGYGLDRNVFDLAYDCLTACAGSYEDLQLMERLFREVFRPKCYDYAIQEKTQREEVELLQQDLQQMLSLYDLPPPSTAMTSQSQLRPGGKPNTALMNPPLSPQLLSQTSSPKTLSPRQGGSASPLPVQVSPSTATATATTSHPTTQTAAVKSSYLQHQYNIVEHYLNEHTFGLVLEACPELVQAFDQQLSSKLKLCYGKDDRYKKPEDDIVETEHLDFTWIIKKAPKEKKSFGLFEEQDLGGGGGSVASDGSYR